MTKRARGLPIRESITRIKKYKTLIIYRIEQSPYWYARFYEFGKIKRKSLKTKDKEEVKWTRSLGRYSAQS